jgi:hypothetical protein
MAAWLAPDRWTKKPSALSVPYGVDGFLCEGSENTFLVY